MYVCISSRGSCIVKYVYILWQVRILKIQHESCAYQSNILANCCYNLKFSLSISVIFFIRTQHFVYVKDVKQCCARCSKIKNLFLYIYVLNLFIYGCIYMYVHVAYIHKIYLIIYIDKKFDISFLLKFILLII